VSRFDEKVCSLHCAVFRVTMCFVNDSCAKCGLWWSLGLLVMMQFVTCLLMSFSSSYHILFLMLFVAYELRDYVTAWPCLANRVKDENMANMMSSHTSMECRGSDSLHQHRQHSRQTTHDTSVEVNRPSVEGIAITIIKMPQVNGCH